MRAATETLLEFMNNAGLSYHVFEAPFLEPERFDLGLRQLLIPKEQEPYKPLLHRIQRLKSGCFYHLQDVFFTNYAIFRLPEKERECWLSIGPTLIEKPKDEQILELLGKLKLPASLYSELVRYFERLPLLKSQEVFDTMCFAVADAVFSGREHYSVKVIHNSAEPDAMQQMIAQSDPFQEETQEEKFQRIQKRYDLENALLRAAISGDIKETLSAFYRFVRFSSDLSRMPDRLRDSKDLGITLNTLLRKAAEEAGVHPFYIDAFSNNNVVRLEQCGNTVQFSSLGREIVTGYCELIQQYALNTFSQPVQNAIFIIQSGLSADLSLAAIAERLKLNRSYFSNLFTKETGKTLGTYVLEKRVQRARHLLATTPLSIQEIAWEVGIPDANYFARLFKRETGYSPRSFRDLKLDNKTAPD